MIASDGTFDPLPVPSANDFALGQDINNTGNVVGSTFWGGEAALWRNGNFELLPDSCVVHFDSIAYAINQRGDIVGRSCLQATIWVDGQPFDVSSFPGTGWTSSLEDEAMGLNDVGDIVGWHGYQAFVYRNGVFVDIDPPPPNEAMYALDINNRGEVVGYAYDYHGGAPNSARAFYYYDGELTMLGALPTATWSAAVSINDRGDIVGWSATEPGGGGVEHPVLWRDGQIYDLGETFPDRFGVFAGAEATDINNAGVVSGWVGQLGPTVYTGFRAKISD